MLRPTRSILILAGLLATAALPAAAQGKAALGISENKPELFGDNDFKALGTKNLRLVVGWDAMTSKKTKGKRDRARAETYLSNARAGGYQVLLVFDRSKDNSKNPKKGQLGRQMKLWKRKFPQIRQVSPWNEGNLNKKPSQVLMWQKEIKKNCRGCKIVIDVVDKPNLQTWTRQYMRLTKVKIWGLHNYVDVNNLSDKRTRAFLKTTKRGDVWLTETGGVVKRNTTSNSRFSGSGVDFAARATTYLFDRIVKRQPRIKRVYIYHWNIDAPQEYLTWDSALKDNAGVLRPAYQVVKNNT